MGPFKTISTTQQHTKMIAQSLFAAILAISVAFSEAAPGHYGHGYYRPRVIYKYYASHGGHHGGMPAMEDTAPRTATQDVVDVAVGAGTFTTLVKIVSGLGLVDTLKGAEALTIFAPSDDAFAKLPAGTLESLTTEQAKTIVLRHVVTAKVPAAAVTTGSVTTIGGEDIGLVKTYDGGVQIVYNGNTVNVVAADVMASNGVIHVIDNVIL